MKIIDLSEEHKQLYFHCLQDWSDDIKEAGNHKEKWFNKMKDKGLRVKLAQDDTGTIGGMIQYAPIENTFIEGKNLYFIFCIWIHGHKQGIGNLQKKGIGKSLLQEAEKDVLELGGKGMVAWGVSIPFFMRASWFKKHGYKKVDKKGIQVLLWKPFTEDAIPPEWIKEMKKPQIEKDKPIIHAFINGWCPAMNMVFERAKRVATEFGDKVIFQEIDTFDKNNFSEWGIVDDLFINGKKLRNGPPPSYEKIKKKIAKKIK